MADEDAELVALIDNEHDEGTRLALLARFATDERLRRRYDELRTAGAPIAGSLEEPLGQAPLDCLRAAKDGPVRQPPADSPATDCDSLRLALRLGSWRQAQRHVLRRPLGC
jgi:hypothetical protein